MRQIPSEQLSGSFEPVLCLSVTVLQRLDEAGVSFSDEPEGNEAGPTEWAALESGDGSQWLIVHPSSGEPEGNFVYVRAPIQTTGPQVVAERFLAWLQPNSGEVVGVADRWPYSRPETP